MGDKSSLHLDFTGLTSDGVGSGGVSAETLEAARERAGGAFDAILARRDSGEIGFLDLPDGGDVGRQAMEFARGLHREIDTMVVVGIGGSSLGTHALYSALAQPLDELRTRAPGMPRRLLFPDNADPVTFAAILDMCPPERTLYCVVTKSGGTAETAAQLLVVYHHLERALGSERVAEHLIAITDPARGALCRFADQAKLTRFPIPATVGGRFSVLSAVGLVPAAVAGLDVAGLLAGARRMRDRVVDRDRGRDLFHNPALMLATLLYLHHVDHNRPMVVMMPYVDALFDTADWFRQLWAESLGKEVDVAGNIVNVGPTPIASRGATDQHSQLQLYAEGPSDKVFLMIGVGERGTELIMPKSRLAEVPEWGYLCGRGMGELLDAELRGTIASLTRRGRPNATINFDRVDAAALGEFFMLMEAATAFAGPLYEVDPFNQPGVEEAKKLAYASFGREGYTDLLTDLDVAAPDPRYVF